jgi:hypothetical protein
MKDKEIKELLIELRRHLYGIIRIVEKFLALLEEEKENS